MGRFDPSSGYVEFGLLGAWHLCPHCLHDNSKYSIATNPPGLCRNCNEVMGEKILVMSDEQRKLDGCLMVTDGVMIGHWRGHRMVMLGDWVYEDTGGKVSDDKDRACGFCGLGNTPEGHDGCLGELAGVMNACCGHGVTDEAYVMFNDGKIVRGEKAIKFSRRCMDAEVD